MADDRYYQDETGQWWFRIKNGTRTRAEPRVCEQCGKQFLFRIGGNPGTGQYCSRACSNRAYKPKRHRRGEDSPNWRGGHINSEGYRLIRVDGKPILEHRHVMAQHIGRDLYPYETVHHMNGDKADNRIENLELWVGRHGRGSTEAHCPTCTCFAHKESPVSG